MVISVVMQSFVLWWDLVEDGTVILLGLLWLAFLKCQGARGARPACYCGVGLLTFKWVDHLVYDHDVHSQGRSWLNKPFTWCQHTMSIKLLTTWQPPSCAS